MAYSVDKSGEIKMGFAASLAELRELFNKEQPNLDSMHIAWNAVDKYSVIWR